MDDFLKNMTYSDANPEPITAESLRKTLDELESVAQKKEKSNLLCAPEDLRTIGARTRHHSPPSLQRHNQIFAER